MPVIFRIGQLPPGNVSFGYSPAQEALHSLHVLLTPRDHPLHVQWVLEARRRIGPGLRAELDRYRCLLDARPIPLYWRTWDRADFPTFDQELEQFRQGPPETVGYLILRKALGRAPTQDEVDGATGERCLPPGLLAEAAARGGPAAGLLADYVADPAGSHRRFADFLRAYWNAVLAQDWPGLEARFAADIHRRGQLLLRRGVAAALEGLSPDVYVDRERGMLTFRRSSDAEVALTAEDRLMLTPSYFAWPHLYLGTDRPVATIAYPVVDEPSEARPPVPPDRLLKLLRAAGDGTRLQILQLLARRPHSTGEMAGLIGITEASVSKHLKQLQEAGLARPERQSYYVFYHLVREALSDVGRGLFETLGAPEG